MLPKASDSESDEESVEQTNSGDDQNANSDNDGAAPTTGETAKAVKKKATKGKK